MAKAKFRMVHTSFWNDPHVSEEMTVEDKYFFLYLLTNEHTTQIGIYGITKKQMAFELGYSAETVNALIYRFEDHHKLIKYNPETREIAIKNWGKYNLNRGGKPVMDCVRSELKQVKDQSLIDYVAEKVENASLKALYDTYHDTYDDTSTIRGQEEEKEKEEEKEEEEEEKEEKEEQEEKEAPASAPPQQVATDHHNPYQFYQMNGFGVLSSITQHKIDAWINDLTEEMVVYAMQIAIENNKVSWSYTEAILKGWAQRNIKTIDAAEAHQAQFKAQQLQKQGNRSFGNQRTENIPDWYGQHKAEQQQKPKANNEPIDFEAERAKVLAKLGGA